jgi:hypothetical protein
MKKNRLLAALLIAVFLISLVGTGSAAAVETRDIVILGTSDIHGNVDNYDYFTICPHRIIPARPDQDLTYQGGACSPSTPS